MQKEVSLYPALGKPGQEVAVGTAVYTPVNYLSDGTVVAGGFAFAKAGKDREVGDPIAPLASAKATAGAQVLGFVCGDFTSVIPYGEMATDVYPEGANLTIARQGDFYVLSTEAVEVGKALLCDPTTGKVTYGEKDAANDTGWRTMTAAKGEGEVIIISCRGQK